MLNDTQFETFRREGYLHLGRLMSDAALEALQQRMDDLTSGKVVNEGLSFQSEPEAPGQVGMPGFAGPSGRYRKIGGLHHDSLIWDFITLPASSAIMRRLIEAPLAVHRAMVLLKPAGRGSALGWHQDAGDGFPAAATSRSGPPSTRQPPTTAPCTLSRGPTTKGRLPAAGKRCWRAPGGRFKHWKRARCCSRRPPESPI